MPTVRMTRLARRLRSRSRKAPLVVAHRGASESCPENTLAAFRAALRERAALIELDARATLDRHLVVIHDASLTRTTGGKSRARVAGTPLAELRRHDVGGSKHARFAGEAVPTLEAALRLIQPRATTMIEHKAGSPELYVELLRRLGLVHDVILQSFDWRFVARAHALEPRLTLGALGEHELTRARLRVLARLPVALVHWDWTSLRGEDVDALHAAGRLVCVYTANADAALAGAARLGVDAITTNRPARLRALIESGLATRP